MTDVDIATLPGCAVGIFGDRDACSGSGTRAGEPIDREFRGRAVVIHPVRCDSCGAYGFLVVQDGQVVHRVGSFFGESAEATAVLEDIYDRQDESIIGVTRYLGMKEGPVARMLERYGIHERTVQASKILLDADPDEWPKNSGSASDQRSSTRLITDGGGRDGC